MELFRDFCPIADGKKKKNWCNTLDQSRHCSVFGPRNTAVHYLSYAHQGDLYGDDTFDNYMVVAGVRNRGNY